MKIQAVKSEKLSDVLNLTSLNSVGTIVAVKGDETPLVYFLAIPRHLTGIIEKALTENKITIRAALVEPDDFEDVATLEPLKAN